jgi:hypothetical protein
LLKNLSKNTPIYSWKQYQCAEFWRSGLHVKNKKSYKFIWLLCILMFKCVVIIHINLTYYIFYPTICVVKEVIYEKIWLFFFKRFFASR